MKFGKTKFVLTGLPGTGKTTTMKQCLALLQEKGMERRLLSTDDYIRHAFVPKHPVVHKFQKEKKMEISPEIFISHRPPVAFIQKYGEEPLYRDLEEMFICDLLKTTDEQILLDLGGKAPLRKNTLFALQQSRIVTILIYPDIATVIDHLAHNEEWKKRSNYLLAGESGWRDLVKQHYRERLPSYLSNAKIAIPMIQEDGCAKTTNELVKEIFYQIRCFENACEESNCFTDTYRA